MNEASTSLQVELDSGKRQKIKSSHVLLRFDAPQPAVLLASAAAQQDEIDLAMAWEFAPSDEFSFVQLAQDYFSEQATLVQRAATLLALHGAPHYFRRGSEKGRFKKADAATLALALAAIDKKKAQSEQVQAWADALIAGGCAEEIRAQLYKILFRPDKNSLEYKAVVQAAQQTQKPPLALLEEAGAITSAYQFHWQRFLSVAMPAGLSQQGLQSMVACKPDPQRLAGLPLSAARAFSIDDSLTTEIDDALSVTGLGTPEVTLGIHIAAPALGIEPGDAVDQWARQRLSTIYIPGQKMTMLPWSLVEPFTLQASPEPSGAKPVVSLYVTYDAASWEPKRFETRIERVQVVSNLRYDLIEHIVTPLWLGAGEGEEASTSSGTAPDAAELQALMALQPELSWLYQLAQQLKARREQVRGKPEVMNRPDYNFKLAPRAAAKPVAAAESEPAPAAEPAKAETSLDGEEAVEITARLRGAPLDLIVAECMIVANSTWGQWLAQLGVPAIYRSQASLGFGVKVRMGTKALPHAGIGVAAYAWSTSPLRRYVDLVNQWQIIAAAQHGATAALAAPFKPKDVALFAIIASFEDAYTNYNQFQNIMERYWTLKYLQQRGITELVAVVLKDGLARAQELPLVLPVLGAQALPRGTRIRVGLGRIDFIALEVTGTLLEQLELPPALSSASSSAVAQTSAAGGAQQGQDQAGEDAAGEEDDFMRLPTVVVAIDVNEAPAA